MNIRYPYTRMWIVSVIATTLILSFGCGHTGKLYLPTPEEQSEEKPSEPTP